MSSSGSRPQPTVATISRTKSNLGKNECKFPPEPRSIGQIVEDVVSELGEHADNVDVLSELVLIALHVVAYAASNRQRQCFSNTLDCDSVKDLLEETCYHCANGFFTGEASALSIEDQFFIDATAG